MVDADVIVVGAGLAGLVAAAEAAEAGRRVLLLDQEPEQSLGGQAWWSFGGLFFVNSPEQRRLRVRDSLELAWRDWVSTAGFDRAKGLSMTESALDGMKSPPDVIVCANDDMALGALEALKARNLLGKVALIGFDALPEALGQIKAGNLTATIEQMPGGQSRGAVDTLVAFLRDGKKPAEQVTLLTPIAITKDNLDKSERLGEVK